ncbi:MAG: hypothetical protein DLM54_00825 [Acidimicrobiales bacterium]|nr:MAG: hypothetical protein DLM54_00825 [Acidimicrobiales bacterium]
MAEAFPVTEGGERAKALWSSGDYPLIAERFEPVADDLLDAAGAIAGRRLLDVAAGTGNVALAAARRGARVLATDLTPRMVELGRARATALGIEIEWKEADAASLPVPDGSVDVVTSCFGLMFVTDPVAVIDELGRVLHPGGRLTMVNWEPGRASQRLFEPLRRRLPLPPGPASTDAADPVDPGDWGRSEVIEGWLGSAFTEVACTRRPFSWDFPTAGQAADYFLSASPMHACALAALPGEEHAAVRAEVETMLSEFSTGGPVSVSSPYLLVTAVRAGS